MTFRSTSSAHATALGRAAAALAGLLCAAALLPGCGQVTTSTKIGYAFVKSFNQTGGTNPTLLVQPSAVLVLGDGTLIREVWVAERNTGVISRYSFDGGFLKSFSAGGETRLAGLAYGPDSAVYMAVNDPARVPPGSARVGAFDTSGTMLRDFQLDTANVSTSGIASAGGLLFVSEVSRPGGWGQVVVCDSHGRNVRIFGRNGGDSLLQPVAIAAHDSSIWVCDQGRQKLRLYRPDGRLVFQFGAPGAGAGQWNQPAGVAITSDGHLLVSDAGNQRVQEYLADGTYVGQFGRSVLGNPATFTPGAIAVYSPISLGEYVYVADPATGSVYILVRAYVLSDSKPRLLKPAS